MAFTETKLVYMLQLSPSSLDLNDDSVSEQLRQESIWWQHYVSELLWLGISRVRTDPGKDWRVLEFKVETFKVLEKPLEW